MSIRGGRRRRSRGQALVEFALVIPIFLLILMIMLDFGRIIFAYHTITQDTEEAERNGVVSPAYTQAKYDAIRTAGTTMSAGTPLVPSKIIGEPHRTNPGGDCPGVPDATSSGNCFYPDGLDSGDRIVVNISVDVPLITPIVSSIVGGKINVSATSIGYLP